jgi:NAD+ kinase
VSAVAVLVHLERPEAHRTAGELVDWLTGSGHAVRLPRKDAELLGRPDLGVADTELADGADLAVSIGGDGTMLHTVDLLAGEPVPIVGVNVGHLGYLTEVEAYEARNAIAAALDGTADVEDRMMLTARLVRPDGSVEGPWLALNEVVLEKAGQGHTVRLGVSFDGHRFTSYAADALIVSTPTGSTAYALSARAAIVAPDHRCLQITPVAPHMLFDRPLVVGPDTEIRIEALGERDVMVVVDGRTSARLTRGDEVVVTEAQVTTRLVTFGRRRFHDILKAKFGLKDR